jgi:hypothetical protein
MAAPIRHRVELDAVGELHVVAVQKRHQLLPAFEAPVFDAKLSARSVWSLRSWLGNWLEFYAVFIGERRSWQLERLVAGQDGGVLGTGMWQRGTLRHDERGRTTTL